MKFHEKDERRVPWWKIIGWLFIFITIGFVLGWYVASRQAEGILHQAQVLYNQSRCLISYG